MSTNKIQHKRSSTENNPPSSLDAGEIAINTNATTPHIHFEDAGGDMRSVGADPTATGDYVRRVTASGTANTWVTADAIPGGGDGSGDYGFWNRNDTDNELTPRTAGDDVSTTGDMKAANLIIDQTTADVTVSADDPTAARTYTFPDEGGDRNITLDPEAPAATARYVRQVTAAGVGTWAQDLFQISDGSDENDIIHWAERGSVIEITTTDVGSTSNGNAWTGIQPSSYTGSGTGLTVNVIRRKKASGALLAGRYELYVANAGENYAANETFTLDLNGDGSETVDCTIARVNTLLDGWVARPGSTIIGNDDVNGDQIFGYFVSANQDTLATGIPQYLLGLQAGGNRDRRRIDERPLPLVIEPLGDKSTVGMAMYGDRDSRSTPVIDFLAGHNANAVGDIFFKKADDDVEANDTYSNVQRLHVTETGWDFDGPNTAGDGWQSRVKFQYDGTEGVTLRLINGETGAGGTQALDIDSRTIAMTGNNLGNQALRFHSANGKYNFWDADGNGGQGELVANNVNFRSLSRRTGDENDPANYDADGEYIGPVQNLIAEIDALRADVNAKRETFQELQVAVEFATDFASLKAAMLVALEDYQA